MVTTRRQKLSETTEEAARGLEGIWTPAVVERIAAHLPLNNVQTVLRFVDKRTSDQLSDRRSTVLLSQAVPRGIFAAQWQAPGACRSLNREQRAKLLCLTASAGDAVNLQVALAASGLVTGVNDLLEIGPAYDAFRAAQHACRVDCCRVLAASLDMTLKAVAERILTSAAARGDPAMCRWAWEVSPKSRQCPDALCSAAGAGQRAVCEACLEHLPKPGGATRRMDRRKAAAQAVLYAARGGRTEILFWLLSLCEGPWRDAKPLLVDAAGACGAATLQRLWEDPCAAGALEPKAWGEVLRAAVSSPTPDWAAKADWALQQGAAPDVARCYRDAASLPDAVARFEWLRGHGFRPAPGRDSRWEWSSGPGAPLCKAVKAGNVEAVEWLLAARVVPGPEATHEYDRGLEEAACERGDIAILEALRRAGCRLKLVDLACIAARRGQLHVLQWLRGACGAPAAAVFAQRGGDLLDAGARSGSAPVLEWLRQQGLEAVKGTWKGAVVGGSEEVLELLREWRVPTPTDGRLYATAANQGDVHMLRALRRLGVSFGPLSGTAAVTARAVAFSPLPALQWLVANRFPLIWKQVWLETGGMLWYLHAEQVDTRVPAWFQEQLQQRSRIRIQAVEAQGGGVWTGGGGRGSGRGSGRKGAKRGKGGRRQRW